MKKLMINSALLLATLLASQGYAQKHPSGNGNQNKEQHKNLSPDERAKKETNKASSELGLTEDQKMKWEQASMERIAANAPLKEKMQGSTTPEERKSLKSQIKSNNKKFDESVLAFLTTEQKSKYEAFKQKKKEEKHKQHKEEMD